MHYIFLKHTRSLIQFVLPHWPRCRTYSTLGNHGIPSSRSSTSPIKLFREKNCLWPNIQKEFANPSQSWTSQRLKFWKKSYRKFFPLKIKRANSFGKLEKMKALLQVIFGPRISKVNISYLSIIHCLIIKWHINLFIAKQMLTRPIAYISQGTAA